MSCKIKNKLYRVTKKKKIYSNTYNIIIYKRKRKKEGVSNEQQNQDYTRNWNCCCSSISSFAAGTLISIDVDPSIKILINGEEFHPKDANGNDVMTFTYNGTTYAPLRALAEAYGLEVGYDPDRKMATVGEYTSDTTPTTSAETSYPSSATMGEQNALKKALSYLDFAAFSYTSLIDQLEYEGFSHDEAVYGADNCNADWKEQALRKAKSYLDYTSFSYDGLIEQLEYEGFTEEEALYGVDNCGADWYEQAVKKAASYLDFSSFSRQGLFDQLKYEGFTDEQAEYGIAQNGY